MVERAGTDGIQIRPIAELERMWAERTDLHCKKCKQAKCTCDIFEPGIEDDTDLFDPEQKARKAAAKGSTDDLSI